MLLLPRMLWLRFPNLRRYLPIFALTILAFSCAEDLDAPVDETSVSVDETIDGKPDSGWVGNDSYEVGGVVRSTVQQEATGTWADLAADAALQAQLVDTQIKFIKVTAETHGWRFNQLAETVEITEVTVEEDVVTITYEAVVDMLGRHNWGSFPTLEDIDPLTFSAPVPFDPVGIVSSDIQNCSESDDGHWVSDYNFHYYFKPDLEDCSIPLVNAEVEITEVFERATVYPEYDQLMQPIDEETVGFSAALVPNLGDRDQLDRFNAHADMLEEDLDLEFVLSEDETYRRYTWEEEGVTIIIDLYDPTKIPWTSDFAASFRQRLGEYTLIHYNGHSSYGTKHLLDDPESFTDDYQIIEMHSCQSYAYYTRQVFRAKATEADPTGFALADIVATGKSSYPAGAPPTIRVLLQSLMTSMVAIQAGEPQNALDWYTIVQRMDSSTYGDIMYGVAGARTNVWQPPE